MFGKCGVLLGFGLVVVLSGATPMEPDFDREEEGCWWCETFLDQMGYWHLDDALGVLWTGPRGHEDGPHSGPREDICWNAHNRCYEAENLQSEGQDLLVQRLLKGQLDFGGLEALLLETNGQVVLNRARSSIQLMACGDQFFANIPVEGKAFANLKD